MKLGLKDTFSWMKDINQPHLWHHTTFNNLVEILKDNTLFTSRDGWVSLTRRPDLDFISNQVAIKLDKDKLRNKYKIKPFAWFDGLEDDFEGEGDGFYRHESEERIPGSITDLDNYILEILIPQKAKNNLEGIDDLPLDLREVLNHPKVKFIETVPWRRGYTPEEQEGEFDPSSIIDLYFWKRKLDEELGIGKQSES